jgi:hypothetical protein
MRTHRRVRELISTEHDGVYLLRLDDGRELRVFVCECYSFGVAEYHEVIEKLGKIDAVVISSAWCGYTQQAKEYAAEQQVGIFRVGELMGALMASKLWTYLSPEQREARRSNRPVW